MVKRLLKCVSDGLTLKQSAIACGIGESTLQMWKTTHPELVPLLEEAREQARQKALETIWKAREDDWRAAESFLKYSFWQDYRSGNQVNVSATATAASAAVTITEEERLRLIAQRQATENKLHGLQDKPPVLEAEVVASEQKQPEPEPRL
jgi:DNA-binding CsgD family transcriptional regulator